MKASGTMTRRGFLSVATEHAPAPPFVPRPPWSDDRSVIAACTGCAACVEACPQRILLLGDKGRVRVDFMAGECTLCGRCAEACPEPVFFERDRPAFEHRPLIAAACLTTRGVVCQSCGDACAAAAIRFHPRLGGVPLPDVDWNSCTGCGACVGACPVEAVSMVAGRD